jgi:Flp pilus assembly protein TadG
MAHRGQGQSVVEFALVFPIMIVLMFAIVDFARVYTAMMSVESAAREAADFGTELGAAKWQTVVASDTVSKMKQRACVAASNLPDFAADPADPDGCVNPGFACTITAPDTGVATPCSAPDPTTACDNPLRSEPCRVTVTLTYDFHLLAPFHIEFGGVRIGFPSDITFTRDSTFAMTDINLDSAASAAPTTSP